MNIESPKTTPNSEVPTPIDVSFVEHCLSLSPEERLNAHEAALELVRELQPAGQVHYAKQSETSTPTSSGK